jgi:hypothetical protein
MADMVQKGTGGNLWLVRAFGGKLRQRVCAGVGIQADNKRCSYGMSAGVRDVCTIPTRVGSNSNVIKWCRCERELSWVVLALGSMVCWKPSGRGPPVRTPPASVSARSSKSPWQCSRRPSSAASSTQYRNLACAFTGGAAASDPSGTAAHPFNRQHILCTWNVGNVDTYGWQH